MVETIWSALADAEESAKRLRDSGFRFKSARARDSNPGPWFRVQNSADDTTANIDIYDEIDWYWGVTSRDFRNQLLALPDTITTINLHINSPGGDVYEAIAIMNCLRQHQAAIVTTVDGYAASSAGFIAVGASDELIVAENAEIMAHLPWAYMVGDANDMRKMADDLERIGTNIASIFAARAGGSVEEWVAVLTAETWWSAQEAVDAGIADRVLSATTDDDTGAKNRFDLSAFQHAGRSNAPAPRQPQSRNQTPPAVAAEAEKGKEPTVALSESALQKLGLDAEADESAIEAAIAALPDATGDGDGAAATEPTIEQVAAVAAKHGLTVLNREQHDQLQAQARDGAEARAQQVREANEATVRDALSNGQITPASVETWRESLAANRDGALKILATIPKNKALAVTPVGHGVDVEDSAVDDVQAATYARITGQPYGKDA